MARQLETNNLSPSVLTMQVRAGASVHLAAREAAILALQNEVTVEFLHNDRLHRADPVRLLCQVVEVKEDRP